MLETMQIIISMGLNNLYNRKREKLIKSFIDMKIVGFQKNEATSFMETLWYYRVTLEPK